MNTIEVILTKQNINMSLSREHGCSGRADSNYANFAALSSTTSIHDETSPWFDRPCLLMLSTLKMWLIELQKRPDAFISITGLLIKLVVLKNVPAIDEIQQFFTVEKKETIWLLAATPYQNTIDKLLPAHWPSKFRSMNTVVV
jgi:hypothetical protein